MSAEKPVLPPSVPVHTSDHTFVSASGTTLSIRIWAASVTSPAPFILHTHGGGFLAAHHFTPPWWLHSGFQSHGYHIISHSYRLAPQVSLDQQLADCLEAVAWCRFTLPSILGGDKVDIDRYVLCGDSAGGLFATLMPFHLPSPPPKAVIDIYGLVDFLGMLDLDRNVAPAEWKGEWSATELEKFLEDRDPKNVMTEAHAWDEMDQYTEADLSEFWSVKWEFTERVRKQAELHVWLSTHPKGKELMLNAIFHPERFDDKEGLEKRVNEMSPLLLLREGGKSFPPTALLHGTGDEAVPVKQSRDFAVELKKIGVPVVECYEEGMPHVWDRKYTDSSVPGWETFIQPIINFVDVQVAK
ncbi:hypothetical protein OQA88_5617 [Cercophora sp. LCS_1]